MSDFSPETRNSAMWSGDARMIAQGKANQVILTKQGKLAIPDLSDIEAVQMGHVMEPVIGRLAEKALGIELDKIVQAYEHLQHSWLKCHFDFKGKLDGEMVLVEAKNYNAGSRSKFDADTGLMPAQDLAQLVHEATVFDVKTIYLAVLFGGQEFVLIRKEIDQQMKADHIQAMSSVWAHVKNGTTLPPEDLEQCKLLYPVSHETYKTASQSVESACQALAHIKGQIKALEATEEQIQTLITGYMADSERLVTVDGEVLATWKSAKMSKSFDSKLFQSAMPDIYSKFVMDKQGSRRFLLKG